MDNVEIGRRLKYAREEYRKLNLQDVADASGVARSTVQRYEVGKIDRIKLPVISAFAEALNINPAWILGKEENMLIDDSLFSFNVSPHEVKVLTAYHDQPEMQAPVDRILGVAKEIAKKPHLTVIAAHANENATSAEIAHDDDIMNDENF